MTQPDRAPTPDEAREIDYVLQKIRFSFITLTIVCWLVALLLYAIADEGLVLAIVVAMLIPASLVLVWTFGFRAMHVSLTPFLDRRTGKLHIPGWRKRPPLSEGLRTIFWDKRETKVVTVGVCGSIALLAVYVLLGSPRL